MWLLVALTRASLMRFLDKKMALDDKASCIKKKQSKLKLQHNYSVLNMSTLYRFVNMYSLN